MTNVAKIEDSELWRMASQIANAAYAKLDGFQDEEKWSTSSRLRQHAGSLADEVAMAVGSLDPRDIQHYLGHARKELFGIKSVYKVSHDNKLTQIDPEQMVLIDKLVTQIDKRLQTIPSEVESWFKSLGFPEKQV